MISENFWCFIFCINFYYMKSCFRFLLRIERIVRGRLIGRGGCKESFIINKYKIVR